MISIFYRTAAFTTAMILGGLVLAGPVSPSYARAQDGIAAMGSESEMVTSRARVLKVDAARRTLHVRRQSGDVVDIQVGDEVRNFDQIRAGDDIVIHYRQTATYTVAKPGTKLPVSRKLITGTRAMPGELPRGALSQEITATGVIVGVDTTANELSVVPQRGGPAHTIAVMDPERQEQLKKVKVGDTLTIVYSEALAIAVERPERK
jgi:hypothetical protein